MKKFDINPTVEGYFGAYGGQILPPQLKPVFDRIAEFYLSLRNDAEFLDELMYFRKHFVGRPSPIYFAEKLSAKYGGGQRGARDRRWAGEQRGGRGR